MSKHDPVAQSITLSDDLLWALGVADSAVILTGEHGALVHANAAALALAARIQDGAGPDLLLGMLPDRAWEEGSQTGRWRGEVTAASGPVLAISLYCGEADRLARGLLTFIDVSSRSADRLELQRRGGELRSTHQRLAGAEEKLLQAEKMASIGQLAAGVAHEINNPIGYVHSNLGTLQEYIGALFSLIESHEAALAADDPAARREQVRAERERLDIDFIVADLPKLLQESREGIERVTKIVQDLKDFSHIDRDDKMHPADLLKGLESTINIVWNDLKYKVRLEKHYGEMPLVECRQSEINQVLMNILLNAGQSIETRGSIVITTGSGHGEAWISVADSGSGIAPEALQRIFDPFFTTKPIGRGTGLGLAIAYGIVAKHQGRIEVSSKPGVGSVFRVVLPVVQPVKDPAAS